MSDGKSDARGGTLETVPAVGGPTPEAPPTSPTAHAAVAPVRAKAPKRGAAAVFKGLTNLLFMALVIYVTYVFTLYFSTRPPAPAPVPESARLAAKKIEELRADERRLLTTYGPPNPATGAARIPIDRAMDLVAAEAGAPAAAPVPAPKPTTPGSATTPAAPAAAATPRVLTAGAAPSSAPGSKPATTTTAAPALAIPAAPTVTRVGLAPEQMYRAICIACHDVDGKGMVVRKAMPTIPDFTDPTWHASRTDADLQHSILDGKGQLMLAMKDKLALGHTDLNEMVAFVRSFRGGRPGAAAPVSAPAAIALAPPVGAPAPAAPTAARTAAPVALSGPAVPGAGPSPVVPPSASAAPIAATTPSPVAPPITAPAPTATLEGNVLTAASPARAAKLRAAGDFYGVNCLACHGPDGRGTAVRPAMPAIPDFTSREWQMSRDDPPLAVSVLDGKGQFMPPWQGKVDPAFARDLVAFIRGFGPADLAAAGTSATAFGTRIRQLRQRWQELDRQAQSLSGP
jgi:mono/diheme cytochrome c family protein